MIEGNLIINGFDAKQSWGIVLQDVSVSALLTPAPMKEPIQNKSRIKHGKRVIWDENPKRDERDISLQLTMFADTQEGLLANYASFCGVLYGNQKLEISTPYSSDIYRCYYISCTQYSSFHKGVAKFILRLNEPNTLNRGASDEDAEEQSEET